MNLKFVEEFSFHNEFELKFNYKENFFLLLKKKNSN